MPVKTRQIETDSGSYYNGEDGQKYFQTVKVPFSMVMKVMIVIMKMRIMMKTMNSSSYLRVLPIIATKQFHEFSNFAVSTSTVVVHCYLFRSSRPEVFCKNYSQKFRKIHRKTPVPESLFLKYVWKALFLRKRNRFYLNS